MSKRSLAVARGRCPYKNNKQLYEKYERVLHNFASDADITRVLNCDMNKILKYSELDKFPCFADLLPREQDFVVLLIEQKENSGHWVCIVRENNNIFLFDSYGSSLDRELGFVAKSMRILLGEDKRFVERMINCKCDKCKDFNIIENVTKFQSLKNDIATCGRWCIMFIEMTNKMKYDLDQFASFVYTSAENTEKPTDILVCDWVPISADLLTLRVNR